MTPEERALIGAKEIAQYLRWSEAKFRSKAKIMKKQGALFIEIFGTPPTELKNITLSRHFSNDGLSKTMKIMENNTSQSILSIASLNSVPEQNLTCYKNGVWFNTKDIFLLLR